MTGGWRRHSAENVATCVECGQYNCDGVTRGANRMVSSVRNQPDALDEKEVGEK